MPVNKIRKLCNFSLLSVLLLGLSAVSQADPIPATWEETIDFGDDTLFSSDFDQHTYVHDLTDDGFTPLSDLIVVFELSLNLFDDRDFRGEGVIVDLPGLLGDRVFFDLSGDEYGGFSVAGWIELNVFGTLTITIDRIFGDFFLGSSTLTAHGFASVPEPGTLALLGIGLLGIGLSRRRRKA